MLKHTPYQTEQTKLLTIKSPSFTNGTTTVKCLENITLKKNEKIFLYSPNKNAIDLFLQALYGNHQAIEGSIEYHANGNISTKLSDTTLTRKDFSLLLFESRYKSPLSETAPTISRWNSLFKTSSPFIKDELRNCLTNQQYPELLEILKIQELLKKQLITLSNGERQRVLLYKTLNTSCKVILLEQILTGLDKNFQKDLINWVNTISPKNLLIFADINRVFSNKIKEIHLFSTEKTPPKPTYKAENTFITKPHHTNKTPLVALNNVTVTYGQTTILKDFSLSLDHSKKLLLTGANGTGKSTILSLLNGDNPQLYKNDIRLNGKNIQEMQSIWEWKKNIGIVSNELLRSTPATLTVIDIIRSGFTQTTEPVGKEATHKEIECITSQLAFINNNISPFDYYYKLSQLEKVMVLFTRSIIHNPKLILLDELETGLTDSDFFVLLNIIQKALRQIENIKESSCILVSHKITEKPSWFDYHLNLI